jgi:hypothetical protein
MEGTHLLVSFDILCLGESVEVLDQVFKHANLEIMCVRLSPHIQTYAYKYILVRNIDLETTTSSFKIDKYIYIVAVYHTNIS